LVHIPSFDIPSKDEILEAYEYILYQTPDEEEQKLSADDTHEGVHAEFSPDISPVQHVDWFPPNNVSIDTTNPSTFVSYNVDNKHKIPQPEQIPLVSEPCLHENPFVEFTISIGILPFFHIPNPRNLNLVLCETSTSDSCKEGDNQKENGNREDSHFFKEKVFKDEK